VHNKIVGLKGPLMSRRRVLQGMAGAAAAGSLVAMFATPFVVLVLEARLRHFDRRIEEAARDLGATPCRVFRSVTLPVMAPAIAASGILVAALSLDEFIITNFVIGANATLPVYIWGQMQTGITPSVNAVASAIMISCILLLIVPGTLLSRKSRRQQAILRRVAA
jgi:ABC-type spermidine/putrescine transport system permease subunit II